MEKPKEAVSCIIFNTERTQLLLVRRRDIPVWVLPGGGKETVESPEDAATREVLEETGYHVQIIRKVAEYLPVNHLTQLTHYYECRILSGQPTHGAETKEVRFFSINQLPKLPPPYSGWITDALQNNSKMLQKKIEGVSYWILIKLLILHPILVCRFLLTKIGIHIND